VVIVRHAGTSQNKKNRGSPKAAAADFPRIFSLFSGFRERSKFEQVF